MAFRKTKQTAEVRLQQLQVCVQRWRETRQKISPMPAELWAEATALACELDVNTVRLAAGLDYGALRQRVEAVQSTASSGSISSPQFVEVRGADVFGTASGGPSVELTDATGLRLTIRLGQGGELDWGRLIDAFRGRS